MIEFTGFYDEGSLNSCLGDVRMCNSTHHMLAIEQTTEQDHYIEVQ